RPHNLDAARRQRIYITGGKISLFARRRSFPGTIRDLCVIWPDRALQSMKIDPFSLSPCVAACLSLPGFVASKGQAKGNMTESRFLTPSATLDIHDLEAGGFRNCELTIIGRRKH